MAYADAKTRASSWSADDYVQRFGEVRADFAALSEKERASDDYKTSRQSLLDEVADLDIEYKLVRAQSMPKIPEERNGGGALLDLSSGGYITPGELLVADEAFRSWMSSNAGRERISSPSPDFEFRGTIWDAHRQFRTLVTEGDATHPNSGGVASTLLPVGQPYLGNVNRQRLFVRDIIGKGQTSLAAVPYVRETTPTTTETTASTVAEGGTKPEAAVQFSADVAPTTVIAVNIPATTQLMQDAPAVVSYINQRLSYMLALREEGEILKGNGIYPDLKGLHGFTGVQTQAATSGEFAITIGNAIAKIELKNGYPSAVAMNPADWWSMATKRAAAGSGTFDAGAPFSSVPDTVWGLDVVRTLSESAGTCLVGDFRLGAQLFDRMLSSVRVFEQHSDFAVKNQVLIQAEERVALANYRPDWFVVTTIS